MRRKLFRSNLGLSVSFVSVVVLLSSCGSNDIGDLFPSNSGGLAGDGADNHAGRGGRGAAGGGSAGRGGRPGDDLGGSTGDAGADVSGGSGGLVAIGGSDHSGGSSVGGHAGSAGHAGSSGGSAGKGGSGGTAGNGGVSGKGGNGGAAGNAGNGGSVNVGGSAGHAGSSGGNAGRGGSSGSAGSGGASGSGGSFAGSGGTSGNSGNGGNSGNSGSAGSSGSGGAGGAQCVENSGCGPTEYCAKASCGAAAEGHCSPRPTSCSGTKQGTVCGCDGITYHDSCLLHSNGQNANSNSTGACVRTASTTLTCSSDDATACVAKGGLCGFKAEALCGPTPILSQGVCWILPATCPGANVDDQLAHACGSAEALSCTSECAAIKSQQIYTLPNSCIH